jgi:hypothetical protein
MLLTVCARGGRGDRDHPVLPSAEATDDRRRDARSPHGLHTNVAASAPWRSILSAGHEIHIKEVQMSKRTIMIILATVAVIAVVGVGVAVAAGGPPSWAVNGPVVTNASGAADAVRDRVRARDGTGPHHAQAQNDVRQGLRLRDGAGPRHGQQAGQGNRGADCPYRS